MDDRDVLIMCLERFDGVDVSLTDGVIERLIGDNDIGLVIRLRGANDEDNKQRGQKVEGRTFH